MNFSVFRPVFRPTRFPTPAAAHRNAPSIRSPIPASTSPFSSTARLLKRKKGGKNLTDPRISTSICLLRPHPKTSHSPKKKLTLSPSCHPLPPHPPPNPAAPPLLPQPLPPPLDHPPRLDALPAQAPPRRGARPRAPIHVYACSVRALASARL